MSEIMRCPTCGGVIRIDAKVCSHCGYKLIQEISIRPQPKEEKITINCPLCGEEVAQGDKFCSKCGFEVAILSRPPPPPEEYQPQLPPREELIRCPTCGKAIKTDVNVCPSCGHSFIETKIKPEPPKPPPLEAVTKDKFPTLPEGRKPVRAEEQIPLPEKKKGHGAAIAACSFIILLLLALGWLGWAQGEVRKIQISPGFPSISIALMSADIRVPLTIRNYGGLSVTVTGGSFSIYVSGEYLGSGYISNFYLSAHDYSYTEAYLHIEYNNLAGTVVAILQGLWYGRSITATIQGNINVQALIFSISLPFSESYTVT